MRRLKTLRDLPSTPMEPQAIFPVAPSPPSAVLTPSIGVHRWIRGKLTAIIGATSSENSPGVNSEAPFASRRELPSKASRSTNHSRLPFGFSLNVVNAGLPPLRAGPSNFLRRNPDRSPDPADLCRLQEIAGASASRGPLLPQPKPTVSALFQPPRLRFAGLPAWLSAPPPVPLALRAAVPPRRYAR